MSFWDDIGSAFSDVTNFFKDASSEKWGSGQPGNQQYDPNYGTPHQNPDPQPLYGTPGGFNPGDPTQSPGNAALDTQFRQGAPGGDGTNIPPAATPVFSGAPSFDESGFSTLSVSPSNSGIPGSSGAQSFDESGFMSTTSQGFPNTVTGPANTALGSSIANPAGGGSAVSGPSAAGGLPGVGGSTDLSSRSSGGSSGGSSGSSGSSGSDKKDDSILKSLGVTNPLGTALAAGGLGYALASGGNPLANQAAKVAPEQLKNVQSYLETVKSAVGPQSADAGAKSQQLYSQGQNLVNYLQTGTLPAGDVAALQEATKAAKATAVSRHAGQGQNADPAQNSVLAAELASIDQKALITQQQMEQQYQTSGASLIAAANQWQQTSTQLTQTGLNAAGLSSDLYKTLVGIDQAQQKQIGDAIANFSRSLSGGGTTINLGKAA